MNVAENLLMQQMQSMANLPKIGNTGNKDQTGSFQDMMDQTGKDNAVDTSKDPSQPTRPEKTDGAQEEPKAPLQKKDAEKLGVEQITGSGAARTGDPTLL